MKRNYYKSSDLVDRLCNAANRKDRAVTFLVGSALTLPDHVGGHGVPGVSDIVDLIRHEFKGGHAETEFQQNLKGGTANQYQKAFEFLQGRRGQDVANRIVRTAVWRALDTKNWPSRLPETLPDEADPAICTALEGEVDVWILPRAVDLFGNLLEPISKSFKRYQQGCELHKAQEVVRIVLPARHNTALPLEPGKKALDLPPPRVAT